MKHYTLVFLVLIGFTLAAQTKASKASSVLSEASASSQGMSPERLNRIDAMLQKAVADEDVPGIVALIARNGKIVFHKAYGMADNTANRSLKNDDIFRIASQTKAITATAVMMMWEEGKFRLDDPISKYIPEFKEARILKSFNEADSSYTSVPAQNQITIRHLLTHTSGIGYGVIDGDLRFKKMYAKAGITDLFTTANIPIGESVKKLAALPLHHNPGEKFTYSEGLDVLGYFVEIVSGTPFDQFLRQRIFDPLGMKDTWFYLPTDKHHRLVSVQHKVDGKWRNYPVTFYDTDYPITGAKRFFSGGAGLSSTTKDYATFLQMYLNMGKLNGVRLLSRTTVETIMANQIGDIWAAEPRHYGLAFGVLNDNGKANGGQGGVGTFDWGGYFNTQYFADPEEQLIGLIFKQTQGNVSDQTSWRFRQMVFSAIDN
ncbi:serine hydrolase domain-containing protein [Arenibacter sp. GZD96]|uniref:serine hydrolase domain-containing protein n=1 Tax=Aurantibrevibacter litoralis TaxID=3106030 RepID=UPI002AFFF96E|nr:serine hydrolase domain-containing protein [Arenibacter sp. GZD-96]MEA1787568.1 serine hydrolase domain-containing protein [Arenibacter sp. GZD-96]